MFIRLHALAKVAAIALACSAVQAQAAYWRLFNIEGESAQTSRYVTYANLADLFGDTNRVGVFDPNGGGVSQNIVGSGSDERGGGVGVPVPEPATPMLAGLALLALVLQRSRARRWHRPARAARRTHTPTRIPIADAGLFAYTER